MLGESLGSDDVTAIESFDTAIDGVVEESALEYHFDILMVR